MPQQLTPLAALAASKRASVRPRQRLLWLRQRGAQLEATIARSASAWREHTIFFDDLWVKVMVIAPMFTPAGRALTGRDVLPINVPWGLFVRWLGRLSFGSRCVCRAQPRGHNFSKFPSRKHASLAARAWEPCPTQRQTVLYAQHGVQTSSTHCTAKCISPCMVVRTVRGCRAGGAGSCGGGRYRAPTLRRTALPRRYTTASAMLCIQSLVS